LKTNEKKWVSELDQKKDTIPLVKKINAQSPLDFLGPEARAKT
jgi:ATP-dependent helicase/nuclease subunit A